MLAPSHFKHDEIIAMDRAYINYEKFEELTERNVVYVTKMKKNLKYKVLADCMDMNEDGLMEYREQVVVFRKRRYQPYCAYHHLCGYQEVKDAKVGVLAYQRL